MQQHFGLYRAVVIDNDDTSTDYPYRCRLKIHIPEIHGRNIDEDVLPWAWPCISAFSGGPYDLGDGEVNKATGKKKPGTQEMSGMIAIPAVKSTVWVMFEQGDIESPVWLGTWIGKETELPGEAKSGPLTPEQLEVQELLDQDLPVHVIAGRLRKSIEAIEIIIAQIEAAGYPNVFVLKTPWRKNVYIRIVSDLVEIVSDDMKVEFKGVSENAGKKKDNETDEEYEKRKQDAIDNTTSTLSLTTQRSGINIESDHGGISIKGRSISLQSENDILVQAGRWKIDENTDEQVVDTVGKLNLFSTYESYMFAEQLIKIISGSKENPEGEIQGRAYRVSGFERHPKEQN